MKTKLIFTLLYIFSLMAVFPLKAQENNFTVSGYVDTYYSYDNDKNGSQVRQFSSIASVRDEFRINLAQITGKYSSEKIRGTATLQFGDIPKNNWPQSPNEYLQYVQEANVGFSPAKNLWIDAGYFLTHIGAEGIILINNIASTLALPTYFEPFYQSGLRIGYDFSPKVYGSLHLLNGYNVLADNNKNKSIGIQLGVKPMNSLEFIYNNLIGNEQPTGSKGKTRIYNNLVVKVAAVNQLEILFGGDFAMQENSSLTDSTGSANAFGALLAFKYKITPKYALYLRGEIYHDKDAVLSSLYTNSDGVLTGLKATGFTFGFEHRPLNNAYVRMETRLLNADSGLQIFTDDKTPSNSRLEVLLTSGILF